MRMFRQRIKHAVLLPLNNQMTLVSTFLFFLPPFVFNITLHRFILDDRLDRWSTCSTSCFLLGKNLRITPFNDLFSNSRHLLYNFNASRDLLWSACWDNHSINTLLWLLPKWKCQVRCTKKGRSSGERTRRIEFGWCIRSFGMFWLIQVIEKFLLKMKNGSTTNHDENLVDEEALIDIWAQAFWS